MAESWLEPGEIWPGLRSQTVIWFKSRTIANTLLPDYPVTPDGVLLWIGAPVNPGSDFEEAIGSFENPPSIVTMPESVDGSVLCQHGFSDTDLADMRDWWSAEISRGDVQILPAMPDGWVSKDAPV